MSGLAEVPYQGEDAQAENGRPSQVILQVRCLGLGPEPAYVAHTAAVLAETLGVSNDEIAEITTENALRVFSRIPHSALNGA